MEEIKQPDTVLSPEIVEELSVSFRGRSFPTWHYRSVPEDMRPAKRRDIYLGRPILFRAMLGPHKGDWYTSVVTEHNINAVLFRIDAGTDSVYVKDKKYR